jgi:cation transport regulator ChaB
MPKSSKETTGATDVPSTIERSDRHAQAIYTKAHDSAVDSYGEGERAHRTAFAALKHSYEKVGDHWEPKEHKGPSDRQAARGGQAARDEPRPTAGGVDANASKKHLLDVARRLDIHGRSKMDKDELVGAIQKANDRATAHARGD